MDATGTWGEVCKPEPISEDAARWAAMLAERKTETVRWANAAMANGGQAELRAALEDLQGWTELQQTDAVMREVRRRKTIRIAVTGHRGKRFDDPEAVKLRIDEVVDQVQRKHPGARWLLGRGPVDGRGSTFARGRDRRVLALAVCRLRWPVAGALPAGLEPPDAEIGRDVDRTAAVPGRELRNSQPQAGGCR